MVDIESDGPIPGDYSMISIGAVLVDRSLDKTFFTKLRPISNKFITKSLEVSGYTREETMCFDDPVVAMTSFRNWINEVSYDSPIFISDNNGYDWMLVCWYFHHFISENPFGYSSQNLGSIYKGIVGDFSKNFKHLRKTEHTHNPLEDAKGNAEAFLQIIADNNLSIKI